jgi:CIC family chloride channel protein
MVGMAAVFAGAARAPITAVIILFEMTQDYRIILPLMIATVVSTIIAQGIEPESIYTLKLKLRGIDLRAKRDENLLRSISVNEAMTPIEESSPVTTQTSLVELGNLFQETGHHGFIVLDDRNELYGIVTLSDLENALVDQKTGAKVSDICTKNVITVYPDEMLDDALRHFGMLDMGRIPVIDRTNPKRVLGSLRRSDIVNTLSKSLVGKHERSSHIDRLRMETMIGSGLSEIYIRNEDAANGKNLSEIHLPEDCVIASIQRGRQVVVPRGHTQLLAGDRLIVLASNGSLEHLKKALHEETKTSLSENTDNPSGKI